MARLGIVMGWLLFYASLAAAQPGAFQLRFDHLTVNEGLSHSDAMAIAQDQEGFLWIGTNKGIDLYDGTKIKNYAVVPDDSVGLSDNRIRCLYVSPSGLLWVGTESKGLNYYDRVKDRFRRLPESGIRQSDLPAARVLAGSQVTSLAEDRSGQLWVGTLESGLFILQKEEKNFPYRVYQVPLPVREQVSIRSIQADTRGKLWIATTQGMFVNDSPSDAIHPIPSFTHIRFPVSDIATLQVDRQGNVWVGSAHGKIYFWSKEASSAGQTSDVQAIQSATTFPNISSLHLDSFGRLWIGTRYGLYIIYPTPTRSANIPLNTGASLTNGTVERLIPHADEPTSLSSSRINQIIEDPNQIIWIATPVGGVQKADLLAKQFGLIKPAPTISSFLEDNYINALYLEKAQNRLWIATRNGFINYDLTHQKSRAYLSQELTGSHTRIDVTRFFQDSNGTLWVGTWENGFFCLRSQTGREHLENYLAQPGQPGLSCNSVLAFAEDKRGSIWVATACGGLNQFSKRGKHLRTYAQSSGELPTDKFTYLFYEAATDVLWASTADAGLLKLQVDDHSLRVVRQFKHNHRDSISLSADYTWPLLKDHRGHLWIGTIGGGLNQLVRSNGAETIRRYNKQLPESDVESLLEDKQGNLWIGGAGLLRFNPQNGHYEKFDKSDGLQSNSFKVAAACQAEDGTMYFGGIHGITFFHPEAIQSNPYPPRVMITGLRIFNQSIGIDEVIHGRVLLDRILRNIKELVIQAGENDFSLDFVALHYAQPTKNTFAYQLEGYHTRWVYPPLGQRTASFTNLPPGRYTFRVKASNSDGVWSTRPAVLRIRVLPPWWKTWWAYTVYGGVILGIFSLSRRISSQQQTLKNKLAVEKVAHEKDKELTELKLRFFTNVSHELRTPLTLILGPMEELVGTVGKHTGMREKVLHMHQQTRKLLDLVNQLMHFRKVETEQLPLRASEGNVVRFLHEIFLIFQPKAAEKHMAFSFASDVEYVPLYFDRNKLEIVMTNLLSNAFKYTGENGRIDVRLTVVGNLLEDTVFQEGRLQSPYFQVCIRDWGVGMNPGELDKIFDVYYQAAHTETMQVIGTGIGLSLVKQIITRHAGEITVESQPGEGTQFIIRLPFGHRHLAPEDLPVLQPEEEPVYFSAAGSSFQASSGLDPEPVEMPAAYVSKLLIVEDNEDIRHYLRDLFEADMRIELASNGQEGWDKTLHTQPDLVLSDIMMPLSNGLEMCSKIKQHPQTMHIPVLLLTARVAAIHELEGLETGADDYVIKPFHPKLLKAKVFAILHNRQKMQEYYQRQILLQPTPLSIPNEDRAFLVAAMKIVEDHLEDPDFTVLHLVHEMGSSQSSFYRRIKSITGKSSVEFIRDVRLKRAAQLLTDGNLRASEVAFKVGFEDLKYFRMVFQKLYQLSPTEYAKRNRHVKTDL